MKYVVMIIDGASGWPVEALGNRTSLEAAATPNLDQMARRAMVGMTATVPAGMEPSSACACMSVLGYDPRVYYKGRAAIEARSLDIPIAADETVFRANLVTVDNGMMRDYSAGHIDSNESAALIRFLNEKLETPDLKLFPGVGYRHILKLKGRPESLKAVCTPPHDIPDQPIEAHLPKGEGSDLLRSIMAASAELLKDHPINLDRIARGELPATQLWLFWGSGPLPKMPSFKERYGIGAAITSGVDLLRGLGQMQGMDVMCIDGVTDNIDNDYAGQMEEALKALDIYDMAVVHVEAPDEAGHSGNAEEKVKAIELIDRDMVGRLRDFKGDKLRVLIMPDHPTPLNIRTHAAEMVPFMIWGSGVRTTGARRFTENEAKGTKLVVAEAHNIMSMVVRG
ncbi:2,3-bisphosphoglycerate-independent phosphoglycerate mutase [Dehalogenimonas formicexedens]|uniref:2,3-bisphosphoglycerate-independent phosphoglycerate mutase n=1 Tax=Dehalogenimonas formicexedens TaxID=1839801 RepID=A0A1P8F4J8_9CHLR|nr:cofactor-independent phosphoglycerate mutase [Dehalogenimonas formicexedens]APV43397.1 2,3-bisphosphoglycerate-independent phosphoglycerate mutase [Dehalogenimonas formicexedens]